jgi:NAD(P)H-dependent FMN reductase
MKISIISSSIRTGRKSHRVALYLKSFFEKNTVTETEILDLSEYNFPLFEERLAHQNKPEEPFVRFSEKIKNSDGIIIVTPEYNGGFPASLKNAIDLLASEWYHKPVAIATVSDGSFGGSQAHTSLLFILWKLKAIIVPAVFSVPLVDGLFDIDGLPLDESKVTKRAKNFVNELLWCITNVTRQDK